MPLGNPLRSEAAAFNLVVLVAVLMGCVIAAALLVGSTFGAGVALGIVIGLVTAILLRRPSRSGREGTAR